MAPHNIYNNLPAQSSKLTVSVIATDLNWIGYFILKKVLSQWKNTFLWYFSYNWPYEGSLFNSIDMHIGFYPVTITGSVTNPTSPWEKKDNKCDRPRKLCFPKTHHQNTFPLLNESYTACGTHGPTSPVLMHAPIVSVSGQLQRHSLTGVSS